VNVDGAVNIRVEFSEPIAPDSLSDSAFVVELAGDEVMGSLDTDGNRVTFTPDAPLSLLGEYTITLTPELTDLAGNPLDGAPYEWTFRMKDGSFGESAALGEGYGAQVAIDSNGNAFVVWPQASATGLWVVVNDRTTDGFSEPVPLELAAQPTDLQVGVIGPGQILAAWVESARVRASTFTRAGGWTEPTSIDAGAHDSAFYLNLATHEDGYAAAVWRSDVNGSPTTRYVMGTRFTRSDGFSAAQVTSNTTLSLSTPIVTIAPNGTATVFCTEYDNQTEWVWLRTRSGASWSSAIPLETVARKDPNNSNTTLSVSQRALAADRNGRVLVAYTLYKSGAGANPPIETRYVRSAANGTFGTPVDFGDRRGALLLTGVANGDALAVFSNGVADGLHTVRYTTANGWTSLNDFAGVAAQGGAYIDLGADLLGNGLLVWNLYDHTRWSRFVPGTGAEWAEEQTLADGGGPVAVAVSTRGPGIAAWAASGTVSAARFDFE
jgi:hypothetical protein